MKYPLMSLGLAMLLAACSDSPETESAPSLQKSITSQTQLAEFADTVRLEFATVRNGGAEKGYLGRLTLENQGQTALPAGVAPWALYLHSIRLIETAEFAGLRIEHVQGDLHRITPMASFAGLTPGETLVFDYTPSTHMVSYTDFMPRAFITWDGYRPEIFASTDTEELQQFVAPFERPEQRLRHPGDLYPIATAARRYEQNEQVAALEIDTQQAAQRLVPTPLSISKGEGQADFSQNWQLRAQDGTEAEAAFLQAALPERFVEEGARTLTLRVDPQLADQEVALTEGGEAYVLDIGSDAVTITGASSAGVFYGIQSLLNLMVPESQTVAVQRIVDAPRAPWRGMHYDMARNFHGAEVTFRLIDVMARYKLNRLHLHLTEDEGWRLEIPGLPELTDIGAKRCFDLAERECLLTQLGTGPFETGSGNGYYTRDEFVALLKYAAERHIQVIPEIDMPGHARAAVKSMDARYAVLMEQERPEEAQQYLLRHQQDSSEYLTVQSYTDNSIDVCMESSYTFVAKVMDEISAMYRDAGLSLSIFHMGGDEVGAGSWEGSPACQALFASDAGVSEVRELKPYFVSRVAALASERGMSLAGWEDGLMYDRTNTFERSQFDNPEMIGNAWDNIWEWGVADRAYRLANNGYKVILSHATHLYFDHPHEAHPAERGYYWAARYTDSRKVFGYMPDHLYANADRTRDGEVIADLAALEKLVGRPLPELNEPQNILGIQGQLWSETVRSAEQFEEMIYPRMITMSERAWHRADWEGVTPNASAREQDWREFTATLVTKELPWLASTGAAYYLPVPGAVWQDETLLANVAWPELAIEYSVDGGQSWQSYTGPVALESDAVLLRSRFGERVSRSTRASVRP